MPLRLFTNRCVRPSCIEECIAISVEPAAHVKTGYYNSRNTKCKVATTVSGNPWAAASGCIRIPWISKTPRLDGPKMA
jgi:hypothetical protein